MTDQAEFAIGFRPDQLQGFRIGVTSDRRSADLIDAFAGDELPEVAELAE